MSDFFDVTESRPEPEAPPGLVRDLGVLFGGGVHVPPEVDEAIAARACLRLGRQRPLQRVPRIEVAAAAAAVLLVSWFVGVLDGPAARPGPADLATVAREREDIDENGRVDILDAFVLARRMEATGALPASWDVNRDGLVDNADVHAVALAAVNLDRGRFQ